MMWKEQERKWNQRFGLRENWDHISAGHCGWRSRWYSQMWGFIFTMWRQAFCWRYLLLSILYWNWAYIIIPDPGLQMKLSILPHSMQRYKKTFEWVWNSICAAGLYGENSLGEWTFSELTGVGRNYHKSITTLFPILPVSFFRNMRMHRI